MSLAQVQNLAAQSVQAVAQGRNLDNVLEGFATQTDNLSVEERAALKDIAFGCQRYLGCLKFFLRTLVPVSVKLPEIENLLLVALYQLAFSRTPVHVVVTEAVNVAAKVAQGKFKGLVNGVLRNFLRQQNELSALSQKNDEARLNHPLWMIKRLKQDYPTQWQDIIHANQSHPPMMLRINCRRMKADEYISLLAKAQIEATVVSEYCVMLAKPISVSSLPGFDSGIVSVQDYGAQQAALLLNPQDGEHVLDACAAPGGKTGHLLERAACQLTALDIDATRLARVEQNLLRLGLKAKLKCADAAHLAEWYDGQAFDAILADIPCSATGVIRRHPDIKWLRQTHDASKIAREQVKLLDNLWQTLKPSGRMLLATCSVFYEENQQQTEKFLLRHPDANLITEKVLLPCEHNDGFYYALLQKH